MTDTRSPDRKGIVVIPSFISPPHNGQRLIFPFSSFPVIFPPLIGRPIDRYNKYSVKISINSNNRVNWFVAGKPKHQAIRKRPADCRIILSKYARFERLLNVHLFQPLHSQLFDGMNGPQYFFIVRDTVFACLSAYKLLLFFRCHHCSVAHACPYLTLNNPVPRRASIWPSKSALLVPEGNCHGRGTQGTDLLDKFVAHLRPPRPHCRREIVHLQARRIDADLIQQFLDIIDSSFREQITFQVMALALESAGRKDAVNALFERPEDVDVVEVAGEGKTDDLDARRVGEPHHAGKVRRRERAVMAREGDDVRLPARRRLARFLYGRGHLFLYFFRHNGPSELLLFFYIYFFFFLFFFFLFFFALLRFCAKIVFYYVLVILPFNLSSYATLT